MDYNDPCGSFVRPSHIVLEQYAEGLGETIPELRGELKDNHIFSKRSFSWYQDPDFRMVLKALDVNNLLVMGGEAHVCLFQTGLVILKHEELSLYLLANGVSSREAIDRDLAI